MRVLWTFERGQETILALPAYSFFAFMACCALSLAVIVLAYTNNEYSRVALRLFAAGGIGLLAGANLLGIVIELIKNIASGKSVGYKIIFEHGLISFGGLWGFVLVFRFVVGKYVKYRRDGDITVFNKYMDIAAVAIPLFHSVARLGCLTAGCCHGKRVTRGVAVHYMEAGKEMWCFPIQLVESIVLFAFFILMTVLFVTKKYKNKLLWIYIILYHTARFVIEFFRGDEERGVWFGAVSTGQIICIFVMLAYLVVLIHALNRLDIRNKLVNWRAYGK